MGHLDTRYSVDSANSATAGYSAGCDFDGDEERDSRSDGEWCDAVLAYLEFRAGSGWRKRYSRRNSPRYNEYLDALRLMQERRYLAEAPCNCARCVAEYGFRRGLTPALPPLYPGDQFFRDNPQLEPLANNSGQYVGYRRRGERWIDRPEDHFKSCRCAKCRSKRKRLPPVLELPAASEPIPVMVASA